MGRRKTWASWEKRSVGLFIPLVQGDGGNGAGDLLDRDFSLEQHDPI
jgi:hypothetical protein